MPLNKACIAKQYPSVEATVTLAALQKYARAYDHENPFFFDEHKPGAIIAPPMYGVVPIWQSIVQVVGDPEVGADLLRLVHGEHDVSFLVPMRPQDVITSAATIRSITTGATGETLAIEITARNQRAELVQKTVFSAFIRSAGSGRPDGEAREKEPAHGEAVGRCQPANRHGSNLPVCRGFGRRQSDSSRRQRRQDGGTARHYRSWLVHDGVLLQGGD